MSFGREALQARLDQARSQLQELQNGTRQEQIDAQQALVQQLDASIADLEVTLSKSTLRAPFDGIVSTQQVDKRNGGRRGSICAAFGGRCASRGAGGDAGERHHQLKIGDQKPVRLK